MFLNICSRYERMRCSRIKWQNYRSVLDEKHTNDNIRSFMCFFYNKMVDSPMSIVLLSRNRNRISSTGRGRCSCSSLICPSAQIGASAGIMSLLSTVVAPTISLQWVRGNLGPLNTLIPSSRGLKIVGPLNHLILRGRKYLSSCLRL
jgi:hypothetical protein